MSRNFTTTLSATLLLLAVASPSSAGWEEGVAAFKAGNYSDAAANFKELVENRTDCAPCYLMYGQSLLKLNRAQEAVTQLRNAYDLTPNDDTIRLPLAQAYLTAKRYSDAASLLKTMDPSSLSKDKQAVFYQMRAVALDKSGDSEGVMSDLQRAASSNPNDAQAQYRYGAACLSNQADCAVPALTKAASLAPGDLDIKRALTKAQLLQGRQSNGSAKQNAYSAAANTAKALVSSSASYDNLMLLGEAQLGAKQYREAASTFERATKANPGDWLALYYLGQAQTISEAYQAAEQNLKLALTKASGSRDETRIWKQLGFVYEKQKNYSEAKNVYRKVGDQAAVQRVEENERIAEENKAAEEFNRQVEELEKARKELEAEMQQLPPD